MAGTGWRIERRLAGRWNRAACLPAGAAAAFPTGTRLAQLADRVASRCAEVELPNGDEVATSTAQPPHPASGGGGGADVLQQHHLRYWFNRHRLLEADGDLPPIELEQTHHHEAFGLIEAG